jgi:outer membrane protein TolC
MFILTALTLPAMAESNFVGQFLSRYRAPSVTATPVVAQNPLNDLIRNGTLPLTVGDLVQFVLQNNLDIGFNRLTPFSTQLLIETFYRPFEPTIRISGTVARDTSPSRSQLTGAPSLSQLTHTYTIGFGQTLATGTNIGVDFSLNRSSSNSAFNTFNPAWAGLVRYSATQHLLRDYGRINNTHQIRIAQNNQKISESQFERTVIDLVTQSQKTYWDLVFTAEDIKVKQRSLDLAQKTLSDNRIQVDIGTLAPIDVVQAESEVATRNEQLVVATYTQKQIEDQVKKLVTNVADPGLVLASVQPAETIKRPSAGDVLSAEEAIRVALENRPELRQIDYELKNKDIDVEYTKNQLLPVVDLSATYTQNGLGGTETLRNGFGGTAPIIAINRGGLGDAFSQLFGWDFTGYSIGFSVQIPLRNRAQQADYSRAVMDRRQTENRSAAVAQQIALEVRNALTVVDMNRARIDTAQKARELAERRLEAEQKKFDLGASTIRFVLEEQRNVTQAQTNEIAALVNYTKALVDYDRAMGFTLKKQNIEIDKTLNLPSAAK